MSNSSKVAVVDSNLKRGVARATNLFKVDSTRFGETLYGTSVPKSAS
eukprot:CAMPEP_0194045154 /NCGR_PEP_ID=MMETSP0009_2-20130614/16528_1 /TAXON_ID=210454 /ORGANISM="Grammatophora oceanica, Strain CCMP 410" /LENGTH=46 /DNA_ID= /DNA_START= /DNA_END= /DNA_ORIENTATION=